MRGPGAEAFTGGMSPVASVGARSAATTVLELLQTRGPVTRAQLGRLTGMPKSTVSTTVSKLAAAGVIGEQAGAPLVSKPTRGRPGTLIGLAPQLGAAVGVHFAYAHVRVVVVDASHAIRGHVEREVSPGYGGPQAVAEAVPAIREALAVAGTPHDRVLGVGVSVALGMTAGVTGGTGFPRSPMSPGWEGFELGPELERELGVAVLVDNDANGEARAELMWGAGRRYEDFVYFKLHAGVGGGLVLDRHVRGGASGEFGHLVVDRAGPVCRCGSRGCLEMYASIPAVLSALSSWLPSPPTLGHLLDRLHAGDPSCRRVITEAAGAVGQVAAMLCNAVSPQAVIVGGALAAAGDALIEEVARTLRRSVLPVNAGVEVVGAEVGPRGSALGAAGLTLATASLW